MTFWRGTGMREVQSAFRHHLDQIAEAELVAQIPAHAQDDHLAVKVPPSKQLLHALQFAHRYASEIQRPMYLDGPGTGSHQNPENGQLLATLVGHTASLYSARFSPDNKRVVTASEDKTARVWAPNDGRLLATFNGHTNWVVSAAFSRDGKRIATASWDGTSKI